ncbi:serine/threonine-protein kinase [Embleya scabrispora]|uniref:serine/threonine-protein kinase n=1 Tax=Embleya scabrispora TaxID=159449 RepID=UPI0003766ABC|nr:serine/threonine-protein kinase [Embleya scabrispora]
MKPLEPEDPRQIGGYRVLRVLGAGGMGRVYLGRNRGGRIVAIKVVRAEWADDPGFRERFRREVDAARRVGGAWTAPVLDADTEARTPWVVTGYVAGHNVYEAVAGRGPLPEATVRTLGAGLAEALIAVHEAGLVHRDIKPSNVLLSLNGPRVIDFGISRAMDASVLTRTGHTVGSAGFMSPEQVDGRDVGPPSDVFSLGSVLVFAASGTGPFGEGSGQALMYRIVAQEPRLDELPAALREIVGACLVKHAASRPTPAELLAALAPDGTTDLVVGNWLPPDLTTALSRRAIELLELDEDGEPDAGSFELGDGTGAPTWDDRSRATAAPSHPLQAPAGPAAPPPADAPPADAAPETYVPPLTTTPVPPPAPTPAHRPWWRRRWVYPLAAALIAGAVVLALLRPWLGDKYDPDHVASGEGREMPSTDAGPQASKGSSGGPSTGSAAAPPPTGPGTLPQAYLGSWSGTTRSDLGSVSQVTVTLTGGKVGDEKVGTSLLTATGQLGEKADCEADLELLSVSADAGVRLTSHLTRNSGCTDSDVELKSLTSTTMSYVSPGSVFTSTSRGTLTRRTG